MRTGKNFLLHSLVAAAAKTHARARTDTETQRENFSFCSFRGERERERERERVLSPESFIFVKKKEGTLFFWTWILCFRVSLRSNEKRLVGNTPKQSAKRRGRTRAGEEKMSSTNPFVAVASSSSSTAARRRTTATTTTTTMMKEDEENLAPVGFQGTFRNQTRRFEAFRDEYASFKKKSGDGDARGGDALEVMGTSRLLEAAIDSSTTGERRRGLGESGGDFVDIHGVSPLPPAWVDVCEHVQRDMEKAKAKIEELQKAQQKALLPTFDVDDVNDEKIVEQLTGECGRLFKRCEAQLKRLGSDAEVTNTTNEFDDIGTKMRKNATRKLAMELSRLSQAFRQRQKEYLNELKNRQDRGPGAEGVDALEDVFRNRVARSHSGFLEQQDDGTMGSSSQMQRQGFANQDVMSLEAEERDTEVKKILQSVTDLAMVMQDMSKLIIDQGTILDSIEYNCATTAMQVDEGRKELVKAEHTQRSGGLIISIYFLMFMCVLMTLIIIFQKL